MATRGGAKCFDYIIFLSIISLKFYWHSLHFPKSWNWDFKLLCLYPTISFFFSILLLTLFVALFSEFIYCLNWNPVCFRTILSSLILNFYKFFCSIWDEWWNTNEKEMMVAIWFERLSFWLMKRVILWLKRAGCFRGFIGQIFWENFPPIWCVVVY